MKLLSRTSTLALMIAAPALFAAPAARAVDVWTVGVNNSRQGWNKFEAVLTPANVPRLKKIREFNVDEKIDVSPLVVGDKLYIFTMTNTAYVFDVNTGAELARRQLAAPFDPADIANPPGMGMDLHNMYRNWGITATPVIDVATNTIYATTFAKPNAASSNQERNNGLWILDANTLADKQAPVLIAGNADNGGGGIANGFTMPYQKIRAGLGLLTDAGGNKAVVVSFSINGENPNGPGHGFVVAYDVRGLNREAGFAPTPAIWSVTPDGGAGGVWMSGSGPAIDGSDIYLATGNGMDPGTKPGNFGESFVKLRYTAGVANVNNGKPALAVDDFWGAFSDFGRVDEDQDLGAAGVLLIPERGNLIGGGKDGIIYNLDKNNLGKTTWNFHFNLPFVASYLPNAPNGPAGLPTTTAPNPNWPIVNRDRNLPWNVPDGKTHHIHGTPVYMERATNGILYLWGENERLKAYNYDFATKRIASFRGEGTQVASGNMDPPGGMPGGRLVVSSNGTTPRTGVVWGAYPSQGNANAAIVPGALVAYDATTLINGTRMKQLFHSDTKAADKLGNFAKYSTPVVANGKVYVGTFSNKVVQYGLE
ncbi:MAG: hypothetical protein IPJ21_19505 [Sterolibacteriaceae bacterium]|uniref:Pyrrolo-quinoline quinone n=1 Tax=Candidatus Methylophosphatis roskildensis TaxID=2899263 RepID=A0A9D7E5S5_9PROT|nr:hypothetical protein [Candidatus Methylophosphatis roskildensis]MBK7665681.1 hypothetical protein [Sterolibacteriaceae bacterium]MBK9085921.1 hypothetical protein [Sterolibacteriaceae bacterium]